MAFSGGQGVKSIFAKLLSEDTSDSYMKKNNFYTEI